jgi:enoyl-CoA hydratase/carnithine racemase
MIRCEPGRVAVVTLDRPPANALNRDFFDELLALLERLASPEVRAVVVTGTGRFFSAGLDLFEVFAYPPAAFDQFTARFDTGFARLFAFPKPVVAAVNGHAIAGGAVLAAAADVRLAAEGEGRIGMTEILLGVPFPVSVLEIVRFACAGPHLVELLYHGRTYPPREALARRLVDEVVPSAELLSRALAAAEELATRPPTAFAATKAALRGDALRKLEAAAATGDPAWDIWRTAETRAAVDAYRERTLRRR